MQQNLQESRNASEVSTHFLLIVILKEKQMWRAGEEGMAEIQTLAYQLSFVPSSRLFQGFGMYANNCPWSLSSVSCTGEWPQLPSSQASQEHSSSSLVFPNSPPRLLILPPKSISNLSTSLHFHHQYPWPSSLPWATAIISYRKCYWCPAQIPFTGSDNLPHSCFGSHLQLSLESLGHWSHNDKRSLGGNQSPRPPSWGCL